MKDSTIFIICRLICVGLYSASSLCLSNFYFQIHPDMISLDTSMLGKVEETTIEQEMAAKVQSVVSGIYSQKFKPVKHLN